MNHQPWDNSTNVTPEEWHRLDQERVGWPRQGGVGAAGRGTEYATETWVRFLPCYKFLILLTPS